VGIEWGELLAFLSASCIIPHYISPLKDFAMAIAALRGRPKKYSEFDDLVASLPTVMKNRPKYLKNIGVFRGSRGDTAWIKIHLPNGGRFKGKTHPPGHSLEIKVGKLDSWSWEQLVGKHAEMQGRADRGEALEDEIPATFGECAREYLARAEARVKDHLSLRIHVSKHLLPTFEAYYLDAIKVDDVNRWISAQLKADLAPATVKRQMSTFKAIMSLAEQAEHIQRNPCKMANPIRGIVPRQRFLDGEEMVSLLVAAEETQDWLPDLLYWFLHSGMRKGEVFGLVWSDIQNLPNSRQIVTVRTSKVDKSRIVPCTKTMSKILQRQAERRTDGDDRVFPISEMTLRRRWEAARSLADLKEVTIHDLRRTSGTYTAISGVDLNTLAGRLGHSDLTMIKKHYAVLVDSVSMESTDKIEAEIEKAMSGKG
jgi:integrase